MLIVKKWAQEDEQYPKTIFGKHLTKVQAIEMSEPLLPGVKIEVASDVDNPFVGDHGAVAVCSLRSLLSS